MDDNKAIDKWYVQEIRPLGDSHPLIAIRLLERYAKGEPIGDAAAFGWHSMFSCIDASVQIATALQSDETSELRYRYDAASMLILISRLYESLHVNIPAVRNLLSTRALDSLDKVRLASLINHIIAHPILWKLLKTEVKNCLIRMGNDSDVKFPRLDNKRSCTAAVAILQSRLRTLLSTWP